MAAAPKANGRLAPAVHVSAARAGSELEAEPELQRPARLAFAVLALGWSGRAAWLVERDGALDPARLSPGGALQMLAVKGRADLRKGVPVGARFVRGGYAGTATTSAY